MVPTATAFPYACHLSDSPCGREIPSAAGALLFEPEVAYLVAMSPRSLQALRLRGGGPRFIALGRRAIRYRRGDVDDWIADRARTSTSDTGEAARAMSRRAGR